MDDTRSGAIVLLEDDDLDAELISAQLQSDGIGTPVRRARDQREYLRLLGDGDVSLILSDFSLPGYDGLAALEAARALAPAAPFIFVSGAIGEERAIETMRRGATDYVLKLRLERLGPAVHRALTEAETRRRRDEAERERDRLLVSERQAREAAEAANRMKDGFLAVVSHELRTPLNAIVGWASILKMGQVDAAKLQQGLDIIVRNARVQARIIEDILDVSRIASGKLHLHMSSVDVAGFITAAVDAVRPAADAKEIALETEIDGDAGHLFADGERLQQVVWNLVANAVKFTPAGGRVRVSARREADDLRIDVRDSGCGIDAALLPHVFEPFWQGDSSKTRAQAGLGLGLAIVRQLVEMHGGTVSATSDGPGRGSTFAVAIPVRAPAAPSDEHDADAPPLDTGGEAEAAPVLAGVRVLVVDDEPDARLLVTEVLRSSGAQVAAADSADGAFRTLESFRPDVLVSDIGMPMVDGYALVRRLRREAPPDRGAIPAIALTAYARDVDRAEAERAGYQRHLAKPISAERLITAVADVVGRGT